MWIYEYCNFDHSGFLPVGPYETREEAAKAMRDYANRFGAIVQGPKEIDAMDLRRCGRLPNFLPPLVLH